MEFDHERRFENRREAGAELASRLRQYSNRDDVLVLALPRGGVPVGYEVAEALKAPLDVFVVRKLGTPGHAELAMGAIASGGVRVLNDDVVRWYGIPDRLIDAVADSEQLELERRERTYRGDRPPLSVRGRTVILVDDGLATGSTMRAAVAAVRRLRAGRVIVAAPVGARDTCEAMRLVADDVVCVVSPERFVAVGAWYLDFSETSDDEVRRLLQVR